MVINEGTPCFRGETNLDRTFLERHFSNPISCQRHFLTRGHFLTDISRPETFLDQNFFRLEFRLWYG